MEIYISVSPPQALHKTTAWEVRSLCMFFSLAKFAKERKERRVRCTRKVFFACPGAVIKSFGGGGERAKKTSRDLFYTLNKTELEIPRLHFFLGVLDFSSEKNAASFVGIWKEKKKCFCLY